MPEHIIVSLPTAVEEAPTAISKVPTATDRQMHFTPGALRFLHRAAMIFAFKEGCCSGLPPPFLIALLPRGRDTGACAGRRDRLAWILYTHVPLTTFGFLGNSSRVPTLTVEPQLVVCATVPTF